MTKHGTIQELVEEAKRRTLIWIIWICAFAYLLSLTSNSVLFNIPIATLVVVVLRYLSFELEIRRRAQAIHLPIHLSHLLRHQISLDDTLLHTPPISVKWRRKIDSVLVEGAVDEFTCHIVKEFVTDLWFSSLSSDQDVPEQLRALINDIIGEVAQRVKRVNLINLLTRDVVDLVGNHLDLFRQAKAIIGTSHFGILSSEEREQKLKQVLLNRKQLHPALLSPEAECKVLRQLTSGVVAVLLRPQDAECALLRCLARELLACAVLRPIMNFASPSFINEVIGQAVLSSEEKMENKTVESLDGRSSKVNAASQVDQNDQLVVHTTQDDWARVLDVVSQRKAKTLTPENLDNLWAKGRNYRQKEFASLTKASQGPSLLGMNEQSQRLLSLEKRDTSVKDGNAKTSEIEDVKYPASDAWKGIQSSELKAGKGSLLSEQAFSDRYSTKKQTGTAGNSLMETQVQHLSDIYTEEAMAKILKQELYGATGSMPQHRRTRSSNTGLEGWQKLEAASVVQEKSLYSLDAPAKIAATSNQLAEDVSLFNNSFAVTESGSSVKTAASKLNCWVVGAHLEKAGSKTFAVYSIAVTDCDNKTWFVERRFRNFEQLHRRLRDLPQYNLQLPPKRFLSSSLDDSFVRDRCILLDKYLKDLLSIPSIAELHEVWDFLSVTSKKYAFSKSPSVMKTLAVNVDDAMDDMLRQLKGVSDGIFRRVGGPVLSSSADVTARTMDMSISKVAGPSETASFHGIAWVDAERSSHLSDDEYSAIPEAGQDSNSYFVKTDGWHSDSELHIERLPSGAKSNKVGQQAMQDSDKNAQQLDTKISRQESDAPSPEGSITGSDMVEDELAVPPEWTPPKLSVPLLNLVDSIFQLQRRGWIRRQVFWVAKQILQLVVGDAIDDWLVAQVQTLRREEVVASAIHLAEQAMWPGGIFILNQQTALSNSNTVAQKGTDQSLFFEMQLEATRRASIVHEIIVEGAPTTLVSLIGRRQYTKCAKDIYYFLQSTVCLKQLAYSLLEVLVTTTFPELHNLVLDIRTAML